MILLADVNGGGSGGYVLLLRGHPRLKEQQGSNLIVKVGVDDGSTDDLMMTASMTSDGSTLLVGHGSDVGLLDRLRHGSRLTISLDGLRLITASLVGSEAALSRLDDCANTLPVVPDGTSSQTPDKGDKPIMWQFSSDVDDVTLCGLGTVLVGPRTALLTLIHRSNDPADLVQFGLTLVGSGDAALEAHLLLHAMIASDNLRPQVLRFQRVDAPNQEPLVVFAASLRRTALANDLMLGGALTLDIESIGEFTASSIPEAKSREDWIACTKG